MSAQTRQHKRKSLSALTDESSAAVFMSTSTSESQPDIFTTSTSRASKTHVFFWSGLLSNWHLGTRCRGSRIFTLMQPYTDTFNNFQHPAMDTFASLLLSDHKFNCGEQWMMAMKAWFFEDGLELGNWVPRIRSSESAKNDMDDGNGDEEAYQHLRTLMYEPRAPRSYSADSKERLMWESTMCKILRATMPRQQKALGRRVTGFDESVWTRVSMLCVIAAFIARAEIEIELRKMYLASEGREFVEGSPLDVVWGVGIHWKESTIENPAFWVGENRLGKCHDEAAKRIREMFQWRCLQVFEGKKQNSRVTIDQSLVEIALLSMSKHDLISAEYDSDYRYVMLSRAKYLPPP